MSVSRRAREKNKSARALLVVLASASTAAALTTSPIAIYPTRPTHAARAPVPTPARPRTSVPAVTPPAPPRTRSSRRAHLAADLGAVAAAVGARGLVDVARDLVARRPNDERVLHRFTEHLKEGFNADPVLTTASYDVASRIKTVWSVDRKLRLQRKDRVDDLRDVAALRVVVESGEDDDHGVALCYRVLRRLASSPYVASVGHVKDYIRAPKANGYQSLHATVVPSARNLPRFEVQIRTVAMDRDATHGDASHRRYKRAQRRAP